MAAMIDYCNYRVDEVIQRLNSAGYSPLDILVVGVTGAGKSTTLNALFGRNVAVVGEGVESETICIQEYLLNDNIRLWDTPGLGDEVVKDRNYQYEIIRKLESSCTIAGCNCGFIDMVVVIIEGANRDMGTTNRLLCDVVVPHIENDRIFVVINQADMAMKGRHWDLQTRQPDNILMKFLDEQAHSVQKRVYDSTGIRIHRPICYSAINNYNIDKLLDFIIENIPNQRRLR